MLVIAKGFRYDYFNVSFAEIAQLVEQRIRNAKVIDSSPIFGTM
jgi:hypothetical protein